MNTFNSMQFLTGTGWDLSNFIKNSTTSIEGWIGGVVTLIGIVCMGIAIWRFASGLWSSGQKQTNYPVAFILLLFGGALYTGGGGFKFMQEIASGGKATIDQLGKGTGKGGTILIDYLKMFR